MRCSITWIRWHVQQLVQLPDTFPFGRKLSKKRFHTAHISTPHLSAQDTDAVSSISFDFTFKFGPCSIGVRWTSRRASVRFRLRHLAAVRSPSSSAGSRQSNKSFLYNNNNIMAGWWTELAFGNWQLAFGELKGRCCVIGYYRYWLIIDAVRWRKF